MSQTQLWWHLWTQAVDKSHPETTALRWLTHLLSAVRSGILQKSIPGSSWLAMTSTHLRAPGGAAPTPASPAMHMGHPHRVSTEMKNTQNSSRCCQLQDMLVDSPTAPPWDTINVILRQREETTSATEHSSPSLPVPPESHSRDLSHPNHPLCPVTATRRQVLGLAWNNRWFVCPPPLRQHHRRTVRKNTEQQL